MSQREQQIQRIAVGSAVVALLTVAVAVVVMWRSARSDAGGPASRRVSASDLVKLGPGAAEQVDGGVRVTDAALRTSLGLAAGDTLTAISGRRVERPHELSGILRELGIYRPRSLFIDLIRDREPVLERWELDGDLATAWRAAIAAARPPGAIDPLTATVKSLSRTRYEVPRATASAWIADPTRVTSGGRGVPVVGPDENGFKLYAIRPGSVYAALGFENGDVVRAINGDPIASGDQILELVSRSTRLISVDILRRGQPIILNYLIK